MQFLTIMNAALLASIVVAAPAAEGALDKRRNNSCGNGQSLSCCNAGNSPTDLGTLFGVIGGVLSLSPGSCMPISVPVMAGSLQSLCGDNVAQCCDNTQGGFVNFNVGNCLPFGLN